MGFGFQANYFDKAMIENRYSFTAPCGIHTKSEAEMNPYRFTQALAKNASQLGVDIYENTEILSHRFTKEGLFFETDRGEIKANQVVYATVYRTQEFAKIKGALIERTFTIATEPIDTFPGWHNRSLIWETDRPYYYLRTTADNRILIGGMDSNVNKKDELKTKGPKLLNKLHDMFPGIRTSIAYEWSAVFGSTKDGLPYIGKHPKYKGVYFMLVYGRNSTVYSMLGAELLKDLILYGYHPPMNITRLDR
ncbi:FAD-binding oxidoreductase [Pseudalkalibacillus hwajinpoensis]|uniref:NAD(P)/FAD-dependent oxidoreductase n=1 Tax=Guptibacillus hwajinpoensis TaxID=208199 RepID=UPI00325BDA36